MSVVDIMLFLHILRRLEMVTSPIKEATIQRRKLDAGTSSLLILKSAC